MYVVIEKANGDRITEFGVTDVEAPREVVKVFDPEETSYVNSRIVAACEESKMDLQSLVEEMIVSADEGDVEITFGNYDIVDEAAREFERKLKSEEYDLDFDFEELD